MSRAFRVGARELRKRIDPPWQTEYLFRNEIQDAKWTFTRPI